MPDEPITREDVLNAIYAALDELDGKPPPRSMLTEKTRLGDDGLGLDSLDLAEVSEFLGDALGISLRGSTSRLKEAGVTVSDVIDVVMELLESPPSDA